MDELFGISRVLIVLILGLTLVSGPAAGANRGGTDPVGGGAAGAVTDTGPAAALAPSASIAPIAAPGSPADDVVGTRDVSPDISRRPVSGHVYDAETRQPLEGVNIVVVGTTNGGVSNSDGSFRIAQLPAVPVILRFRHIGYRILETEPLSSPRPDPLEIALLSEPIPVREVTVTPSRFSVMGTGPVGRQTMTRAEVEAVPSVSDDAYRAVSRLPGVSSSDFSARFHIRGSEHDEVLVLLDGFELTEPFHLRDVEGGALGVVDVTALDGVELLTGGFPANYGDRMGGVFNLRSRRSAEPGWRFAAGASLTNAQVRTDGTARDRRRSWLFSARRGYVDLILGLMGEEDASPRYHDVLGRVDQRIGERHLLGLNVLHARDTLSLRDYRGDDTDSLYLLDSCWLSLESNWSPRLRSHSILSLGRRVENRSGVARWDAATIAGTVEDERSFSEVGFGQEWGYDVSKTNSLSWGGQMTRHSGEYDYFSHYRYSDADYGLREKTIDTQLTPAGNQTSIYVSDRAALGSRVLVEVGVRFDQNALSDTQGFSPRLGAAWEPRRSTVLRGAWGDYRQSEGIHEIAVEDGETTFQEGDQHAEHRVLSLEHRFQGRARTRMRLEAYDKLYRDVRPAYRNISNYEDLFPEINVDRARFEVGARRSRGLELSLATVLGAALSFRGSYALAEVREEVTRIIGQAGELAEGLSLPTPQDQRHTIYLDLNYRPNDRWTLSSAWHYRSGWSYTAIHVPGAGTGSGSGCYTVFDDIYGSRFPAYHRLDLRVNRHFSTARGRVSLYLDVINAYDRKNVSAYATSAKSTAGECSALHETFYWFGLLPALGVRWETGG